MTEPYSVYTLHQAKYVNNRLTEVVILCRDEPEPPVMFYEEQVLPVAQVINLMDQGDLVYAQWGTNCFPVELTNHNNIKSIEVVPNSFGNDFSTLAKLPWLSQES